MLETHNLASKQLSVEVPPPPWNHYSASAAIQLYDPLSPAAWVHTCVLLWCADSIKQCHEMMLRWDLDKLTRGQSVREDMHMYQLNIAHAAANALKLHHDCTKASAGSSGAAGGSRSSAASSSSSSSSSRAAGSSNTDGPSSSASSRRAATQPPCSPQQVSNLALQEGARDTPAALQDTDAAWAAAARAWQHASEMASSLTPMQQELFRQLGVDPRVLLWVLDNTSRDRCIDRGTMCAVLHEQLFAARALQQQGRRQQQQQRQEQGLRGQPQQGQLDWSLDLRLNLLLQCAVLPGIVPLLRIVPTSEGRCHTVVMALQSTLTSLADLLCDDVDAALEVMHAAGLQGFPLQACLKELLHNLLLLPKPLAALTQQQQAGTAGTTSSNGSSAAGMSSADIADSAAPSILLLAIVLGFFPEACWKNAGPAAAAAFAGVGTNSQRANQQQQQDAIAELLRCQCAEVFRHLDSCVRLIAAASASMGRRGANLIMPSLSACNSLLANQHSVQLIVQPAVEAGPGSQEHWQLYSLLASMLKCIGSNADMGRNSSSASAEDQAVWRAQARVIAGRTAALLLPPCLEGSDPGAPGGASTQLRASAAAAATHLLPSLVLIGRAILQWAQELEQVQAATQQGGALVPLGNFSAAHVCGLEPLSHDDPHDDWAHTLADLLMSVQTWLGTDQVAAGLAAAGYQPQELQRQLELLRSIVATDRTWQQRWTQPGHPLVPQLAVLGAALSNLAVPNFCNNSSCSNVSGPTELQLVSGRSCMCGGCLTARYCSKACQRQHWKQHKPVCQALAAAAAAAAAPPTV